MSVTPQALASAAIAGSIALSMTSHSERPSKGQRNSSINAVFYHTVMVFEGAMLVFEKAGLLTSDRNALQLGVDELVAHFSDPRRAILFPELLETFVSVGEHFGHLSVEREPFAPAPDYLAGMSSLVDLGYAGLVQAVPSDARYVWTDAIGETMQRLAEWDHELRSLKTIQRHETDLAARRAFASMPLVVTKIYFEERPPGSEVDLLGLIIMLSSLQESGEWCWASDEVWLETSAVAIALIRLAEKQ